MSRLCGDRASRADRCGAAAPGSPIPGASSRRRGARAPRVIALSSRTSSVNCRRGAAPRPRRRAARFPSRKSEPAIGGEILELAVLRIVIVRLEEARAAPARSRGPSRSTPRSIEVVTVGLLPLRVIHLGRREQPGALDAPGRCALSHQPRGLGGIPHAPTLSFSAAIASRNDVFPDAAGPVMNTVSTGAPVDGWVNEYAPFGAPRKFWRTRRRSFKRAPQFSVMRPPSMSTVAVAGDGDLGALDRDPAVGDLDRAAARPSG